MKVDGKSGSSGMGLAMMALSRTDPPAVDIAPGTRKDAPERAARDHSAL
jgi:hypothetical protein